MDTLGKRIEQNQLAESEGLGQLCMEVREILGFGVLGCKGEGKLLLFPDICRSHRNVDTNGTSSR